MSRLAPRWAEDQRAVIVRAIVDQHMTARAACEAAKAGKLGNEPFDMPIKTARYYAANERQRRELDALPEIAKQGTRAGVRKLRGDLLTIASTLTRDLRRQGRKAPARKAIEIAKLLQEIQRLDPPSKHDRSDAPQGGEATPQAPPTKGFLDQLASRLDPPPTNTTGEETHHGDQDAERGSDTSRTPAVSHASRRDDGVTARASVSARRAALARVGQQLG